MESFRNYLRLLARTGVDASLQGKADPSDVVQEVLLKAHQGFDQFRGQTEAELAGWLRQILANTLADLVRHYQATAARALTMIPAGASVAAQAAITPHLDGGSTIYMLSDDRSGSGADVDFVIAAPDDLAAWPLADAAAVRNWIDRYRARGYVAVFDEHGWTVLRR